MTQPVFQAGADSSLIYGRMKGLGVGEEIGDDALSQAIGRSVKAVPYAVRSALNRLMRDDHMVFGRLRGVGYRRLNDTEIVDTGPAARNRIRNTARKAIRTLGSIESFAGLSPKKQLEHTTGMTIFATVAHFSSDKSAKKIEQAAHGRNSKLPLLEAVAALYDEKK